ncbi:MED14-domain-containing protein [Dichomitus squalens LYAD-421 SS1]|uniref:Mediator of RNA polymerase II transcription subunit 14 n=2 Tax=Dichomitus squalens TaxID=114155 RepID=A0A4Q9PPJ0_9APHY|nr:MED14-domain-containing protein [Dichomitus squalens LYAD-421 SS1]EJF55792.1 MED14-domain-containing protein [Dichomitus squalens LYAD-421 SS1]TBU30192.1 MED14-domain-containing protein [Dichomitus squalens]TBU56250.1 MED14-domain-containing protein [Dichomitus squalens]
MDTAVNGRLVNGTSHATLLNGKTEAHELPLEVLESELPLVHDGQIPLGELVSRLAQSMYAELVEMAETMPHMSDTARKRQLADWVVKMKRQVVKVYAIAKWSRDAGVVQKAMNITAFLMDQNRQFEDAILGLKYGRDALDPARLRNHDLLTSLDVLTTSTYRRLPSCIKELIVPPTPLTDDEVARTFADIEDAMRYRLRMSEIVPWEMSEYRIGAGRVFFTAPKLFELSLCLRGARSNDGWFFVNVTFLFTVGGDQTGMQEFPRTPSGILKRNITEEADARLAFYLPPDEPPPPGVEPAPRPQLPQGVVDAPLVRVFNFLQMMSLSYQLEILWYQAERMRSLGWAEFMSVEMTNNRQTMAVKYWVRKPPPPNQKRPPQQRPLPALGGKLTISIVQVKEKTGHKASRSPRARVLAELQSRSKLDESRPSDEVEHMRFDVRWEPENGALGVTPALEDLFMPLEQLRIDPENLDMESLLLKVIRRHTESVMKFFQTQLQRGAVTRNIFSPQGEVVFVSNEGAPSLRIHLCADEVVIVTVDPRTGRLTLRDTGDLAAAGRGPRFAAITQRLNDAPFMLPQALVLLRNATITDLAEQKVQYLGLQSFRTRNFSADEIKKLGQDAQGQIYIQLGNFPTHYLVLVITDQDFRYALISAKEVEHSMNHDLVMEDIGWLNVRRIHGDQVTIEGGMGPDHITGQKRKREDGSGRVGPSGEQYPTSFRLETNVLRELYAYCCARVAYTKVEQQFKLRGIPYTHVSSTLNPSSFSEFGNVQSSLARTIPALCVQSSDILSGAPAAEAAMPNIRVIPLNWWSTDIAKVVTCVKLKYVQQPIGKRASGSTVIRPSKRIIYDTREAIVSFLSDNVDKCVDEFLEEWARVSKMVVIAREVAQMSTKYLWTDVRLISFDLQTVEFAYADNYSVSLTCTDQLATNRSSYHLRFSRVPSDDFMQVDDELDALHNPHEDAEVYLCNLLGHGKLSTALHRLVALLRETLPVVAELEDIRVKAAQQGHLIDTFPKSAGWFRILYGDLRHALDFRLMTGARIVILDGSHTLFDEPADSRGPRKSGAPSKSTSLANTGALQPIPDFRALVSEAIKEAVAQGVKGQFAPIDIGVICDITAVRVVGRRLYEKVFTKLAQTPR